MVIIITIKIMSILINLYFQNIKNVDLEVTL
jgi:hypothetical protein